MIVFLLAILSLSSGWSQGQTIEGTFHDNGDIIAFRNGMAQFEVFSEGGLVIQLRGNGKYEIVDNFLLIHTGVDKNLRQSYYDTTLAAGSPKMTFVDEEGNPLLSVNITYLDLSGEIIGHSYPDARKMAHILQHRTATVQISFIGYDDVSIKLRNGYDYKVTLAEGQTLEDKTVVFKIISSDLESLNLKLFSEDFTVRQNVRKDLARLERKVKPQNLRLRRFLK